MTTETKATHTPGPWTADVHIPRGSADGEWRIHAGREWVALLNDANDADETEPNARLIAAAPELLEAARGVDVLYAELQAALPAIANTPAFDIVQEAVRRARAAIAKAEGRE